MPNALRHLFALANLAGFAAGVALYMLLLAMTWRARRRGTTSAMATDGAGDLLPLATGTLGLLWNVGALAMYAGSDFGMRRAPLALTAVAFCALALLPAVVVHSVVRNQPTASPSDRPLTSLAYGISLVVALLHLGQGWSGVAPSPLALRVGGVGYLVLLVPLLWLSRRARGAGRAIVLGLSMAVFAVSAFHVAEHADFASPWYVELIAHHSSVPLALVILYEDHRFALGDRFLTRAAILVSMLTIAFATYALVILPVVAAGVTRAIDPLVAGAVVTAIVAALLLQRTAERWLTDVIARVLLRRHSVEHTLSSLALMTDAHDSIERLLDAACDVLGSAFRSREVCWWSGHGHGPDHCGRREVDATSDLAVMAQRAAECWARSPARGVVTMGSRSASAVAVLPLAEAPRYALMVRDPSGDRRLLSDDIRTLEGAAVLLARRGDVLRIQHERFARALEAEESRRLATDAELVALRSQLNPHFLFNALTTVGSLITEAPDRALDTLIRLTELLRRVLTSDAQQTTLHAELEFLDAYLAIERERFGERLTVHVQVPTELGTIVIPPFAVQTLVENAIKHGIAPLRAGGTVRVTASLDSSESHRTLVVRVTDSSPARLRGAPATPRRHGVGLANLERRVRLAHGPGATLTLLTDAQACTIAELRLPLLMEPR